MHDSPAWREIRNAKLREWVQDPAAEAWLLDLWAAYETVDDLVDKDKPVSDDDIFRMLFTLAVDCPGNPFFLRNAPMLIPVLHLGINHWIDSVQLEREGSDRSLRFSYVLRAAYMSITQTVIELTRGREAMRECSPQIIEFFGSESFQEYTGKIRAGRSAPEAA